MDVAVEEEEMFGDDELWFGSKRVQLARVAGEAVLFDLDKCAVDFSDDALRATLARAHRMYGRRHRQRAQRVTLPHPCSEQKACAAGLECLISSVLILAPLVCLVGAVQPCQVVQQTSPSRAFLRGRSPPLGPAMTWVIGRKVSGSP